MTESKHPLKVFLCHASTDKPKVRDLYRYLKKRGIQPWFDEEDLVGGQDWQIEIPKALATSDAIIICLTKNSVDKEGYIQKEIKFALDKALEMPEGRIFLIPVKFEECEVPFTLSRYQWVDLTVESGYAKMMKALKFRASQLERSTVEILKKDAEEENLARGKKESESTEQERKEKELREKQVREDREKAAREKEEYEAAEKVEKEKKRRNRERGLKKIDQDYKRDIRKIEWQYKWETFVGEVRYRLKLLYISRVPILILLVALAIVTPLLIHLYSLMPEIITTLNNVPTATLGLSPTLQPNLTSTKAFIPTEVISLSSTPTKELTPTPTSLPTEITDAKGMSMVLVPAGNFIAGKPDAETEVFLQSFYIDKYEVTNSGYSKCVSNGKCSPPAETVLASYNYYGNSRYDNYPVVWVNITMARSYCTWRGGRLPSGLEWEKAARGTDGRIYPWGDDIDSARRANSYGSKDGYEIASPVGSFPDGVSPYGAYDMAGNVWEWTNDLRSFGGSWVYGDLNVYDYYNVGGSARFDFGFRCAKDAP